MTKKILGALSFLLLVGTTGASGQYAPWCAFYGVSTYNCGFRSYQQCLATIRGLGGYCAPNHFAGYGLGQRPDDTRLRRYR